MENPNFQPRWLPKKEIVEKRCSIATCTNPFHCNTNLVSASEIERLFHVSGQVVAFTVAGSGTSVGLCIEHYRQMYSMLHPPQPCASCGSKPKRRESFSRRCPAPDVINAHLNNLTCELRTLTSESCICLPCYKYCNNILQQLNSAGKTAKPDTQLGSIDEQLSHMIHTLESLGAQNLTTRDYIELMGCLSAQTVAEHLKKDEALLLPVVYRGFVDQVGNQAAQFPGLCLTDDEIPSIRWLLTRLHMHLGPLLEVQCKHRKYGSVLFRQNGDLVTAVSAALGQSQTIQKHLERQHEEDSALSHQLQPDQPTLEQKVEAVSIHINDRLHKQAQALQTAYKDTPGKYKTLNLQTVQDTMDPVLVSFINKITQSIRGRKRRLFPDETDSQSMNMRSIRQLYTLCVLLFCTESTCCMPLHILLTEAIICNGGSLELVRMFNRIGAVASLDTSSRLSTMVVHERLIRGPERELFPNTLTVASVDNIDILQPYAMVSSTDATRSWHGTSVQCTQPMPKSCSLSSEDLVSRRESQIGKHPASSPIASPLPLARAKRRRRTLTKQASPHTQMVVPVPQLVSIQPATEQTDLQDYPNSQGSTLSVEQFKVTATEEARLDILKQDLFHCVLLKYGETKRSCSILPGLPSLLNCIRQQTAEKEVSNVVYLQILSEKADSKATLRKVLANLQKVFVTGIGQKWLIVVGDAKTYDILQDLRREYGTHLKWLIPFPGDWHVLFNYQKVIMKAYADAGLVHLAKASGHRSETLTSLINCSNFKRTHRFLLQTFLAFYQFFISLYVAQVSSMEDNTQMLTDPEQFLLDHVGGIVDVFASTTDDNGLPELRRRVSTLLSELPYSYSSFDRFMSDKAKEQDTIRFWLQFVTVDIFSYIALYTGIRTRNWQLRTGSLKLMASVFSAFDRPIYQRLIPQHLKDLAQMPPRVLQHLQDGGFSVRLTSTEWHAVALDECHEMKVNKDAKLAVVRPSERRSSIYLITFNFEQHA